MVNIQGKLSSLNKSREKNKKMTATAISQKLQMRTIRQEPIQRDDQNMFLWWFLPALLCNSKKKLKVNAMLDPCSTGSYVTENAAEELVLTISGTGSSEVRKNSHWGMDGCTSKTHSGYLHEHGQRTGEAVIPQQIEREKQENDSHSHLTETTDEDDTSRTYTMRRPEHVSLICILYSVFCNQ